MKLLAWRTTYKTYRYGAFLHFFVAGVTFVGVLLNFILGQGIDWRMIGCGCMFFAFGITLLHKSRQDKISEHGSEAAREAGLLDE